MIACFFFSLPVYHGLKIQISYFKCLDGGAYDGLKTQIRSFKEVKVELLFENANKRFLNDLITIFKLF